MKTILTVFVSALLAATALAQTADLNTRLRVMALARDAQSTIALIEKERPTANTQTAEWLAGVSWAARGASFVGNWAAAQKYAQEAYDGATELLAAGASIHNDPDLETAVGASVEVLGQAAAAEGDRAAAVEFLHAERERFRGTAVETRIQKNYLLVGLEGKPMPRLAVDRFIGPELPIDTAGKVTVFFFWAHWCSDCKAQIPRLERLHASHAERGLTIIGPTRLYGYVGGGQDATPAQEIAYMEGPRKLEGATLDWMPKPLSNANFINFGVSTTPTMVIVDRQGIVRHYHPGQMSDEQLDAAILPLL
ncbi:MAG: TlpA disulfide reductase family protein [Acidobacteria bacterium]|nr:TlpA disulfide reductase family protein [Acidobacteriota bacterium]MDA1236142.1 TlpA disulfide reductase family protein [Acidobacteriota bacterium]